MAFIQRGRLAALLPFLCALFLAIPAVAQETAQTSPEEKVLNIFCWSEYLPQEALDKFTEETGIKVVYSTFESNEAMFAKLKLLDGKGYDLIVPSTYFIEQMRNDGLLRPLDKEKLTNLDKLDPRLMNQEYDPGNAYSIPYMWGATGLMVNKNAADPATITSWGDLMRPEFRDRIILSDDIRDVVGFALKLDGNSLNSRNEDEIKKAFETLEKLKPAVRVFDVTATKQAFIGEEVVAGIIWNGDAFIAIEENPDLAFIYPKEGAALWVDNFAIPKGSEHPGNAHKFIDFMLRPENAALVVEEFKYSTPNLEAKKFLPENLRESRLIFPTDEDLRNSEVTTGVGEAKQIYERLWEKLKTGN